MLFVCVFVFFFFFFFNDTATTEIYTLPYTTLFRAGGVPRACNWAGLRTRAPVRPTPRARRAHRRPAAGAIARNHVHPRGRRLVVPHRPRLPRVHPATWPESCTGWSAA